MVKDNLGYYDVYPYKAEEDKYPNGQEDEEDIDPNDIDDEDDLIGGGASYVDDNDRAYDAWVDEQLSKKEENN